MSVRFWVSFRSTKTKIKTDGEDAFCATIQKENGHNNNGGGKILSGPLMQMELISELIIN